MTSVEVREKLSAVNEELNALLDKLNSEDPEDVEAIDKRSDELIEQKKELEKELRNAEHEETRAKVEGGAGKVVEAKHMEEEKRTFAPDTVEYRDAWLKTLMGKPVNAEERAAVASAAAVIPTETANKIYGTLEKNPLINEVGLMRVPGYISLPVGDAKDASWLAMATASTDSADAVTSISLGAKKLIKTIEITADMASMAVPAFQQWIVAEISAKMGKAICAGIISGAGTNDATGVLTKVTAAGKTIDYAGITAAMGTVASDYHSNAIFVMSSKVYYGTIIGLVDAQKRPLTAQGAAIDNGVTNMLLGHRVVFDDNAGSSVIYGDFRDGYVFNFAKDIAIEADTSVGFRAGSTVYRGLALADGNVVDPSAFAVITPTA